MRLLLFTLVSCVFASTLDKYWNIPQAFEAETAFHIPYIPFTEPLRVQYDSTVNGGSQRFSFWNGANILINSVAGPSFVIQPSNNVISCFNTTTCTNKDGTQYVNCTTTGAVAKGTLQDLFPNDMSLFVSTGRKVPITRCESYVGQYSTGRPRGAGGEYSNAQVRGGDPVCTKVFDSIPIVADEWAFDTKDGGKLDYLDNTTVGGVIYLGRYRFYTGPDGSPVQLRFIGHNIVLGGSHFDEYILDYLTFQPIVNPAIFSPPAGMYCPSKPAAVSGPTMKVSLKHPHLEDYHMLMPEGQALRDSKFEGYNKQFKKTHANAAERAARQSHFHHSLRYVNAFNRQQKQYFLKINHLSDQPQARATPAGVKWTPDLTKQFVGLLDKKTSHSLSSEYKAAKAAGTLPFEVDWRQQHSLLPVKGGKRDPTSRGYFTNPPKDQGTCGSCWSFGAVGNLEGQLANISHNDARGVQWPNELSEQNIMDCAWYAAANPNNGNSGCDGGQDWLAFEWMLKNNNGSVASAPTYGPYMNQNGFCHFDERRGLTGPVEINGKTFLAKPGFAIKDWGTTAVYACSPNCTQWSMVNMSDDDVQKVLKSLKPESIDNLFDKVWHHGPLSVSIDATPPDFYYYGGGIYDNLACTSYQLDHSVLVVGFGTNVDGRKYWIVKNSWSSSWGEDGYVRIAVDQNPCGVATTPMYVEASN